MIDIYDRPTMNSVFSINIQFQPESDSILVCDYKHNYKQYINNPTLSLCCDLHFVFAFLLIYHSLAQHGTISQLQNRIRARDASSTSIFMRFMKIIFVRTIHFYFAKVPLMQWYVIRWTIMGTNLHLCL